MSETDGGTSTATATATDAGATTTTAATGTETATQGTTTQAQEQQTVEQLRAEVDKWKTMSRKNEADKKANQGAEEARVKLLNEIAAKLGIQTAGGQPDPAAITAQLETAQHAAKASKTENAVLRAAMRLGADGDALLDSRAFVAQLEGLDGTEAIEAAIKLAMAQSPAKYVRVALQNGTGGTATATAATGTVSASSAGDFTGAAGGARQWTDADVAKATPAQLQKAMDQGLLKALLGG